jgi:5-formyltetrahydrofolate cyclo-ligase
MNDTIRQAKIALRTSMRQRLAALDAAARAAASVSACQRLMALPEYQAASSIALFLSLPDEIDMHALLTHALASGKRVVAPRVDWAARTMSFVEFASLAEIVGDARGLRTPAGDRVVPPLDVALFVIPGFAFDESLHRLGRGGGFYDRLLANAALRQRACGLAFEQQVLPEIPHEPHDAMLPLLVTDQRTVRR